MKPAVQPARLAAWRALLYAHASVVGAVEEALAAALLPPLSWYDVLAPLHRAPGKRLRMRDLGSQVTISRSGLVRLVDRVEAAGLLRRERVADDRRGVAVVLTDDGAAMLRRMWPVYGSVIEARFASLITDGEAAALQDALGRVLAGGAPEVS